MQGGLKEERREEEERKERREEGEEDYSALNYWFLPVEIFLNVPSAPEELK